MKRLNRKSIFMIAAVACFIAGAVAGALKTMAFETKKGPIYAVLSYFLGKEYPVPGYQPDGSFLLGSFETEEMLGTWETLAAKKEISQAHAAEGESSVRVVFKPAKEAYFEIEKYFTSHSALFDWSAFKSISFFIFNPSEFDLRLIFQMGDRKGRHYKQDLVIKAKSGEKLTLPISPIAAEINIKRIAHMRFFIWQPQQDYECYFDDVRLLK